MDHTRPPRRATRSLTALGGACILWQAGVEAAALTGGQAQAWALLLAAAAVCALRGIWAR